MALIVEDGTGRSDSESYISVTDCTAYLLKHATSAAYTAWNAGPTADQERALRLSTQYMDAKYGLRWKGYRKAISQLLNWPRSGLIDRDGYFVDSASVPLKVQEACCELALRAFQGTSLFPDQTTPGTVRETDDAVGPLRTRRVYGGAGYSQLPSFPLVDNMLQLLLQPSGQAERS